MQSVNNANNEQKGGCDTLKKPTNRARKRAGAVAVPSNTLNLNLKPTTELTVIPESHGSSPFLRQSDFSADVQRVQVCTATMT